MAEEYSVSLKVDSKDAVQGLNEANKAVNALDKEFQDLVQEMNGDADKAFESIQNKMLALAQAGKRGTEEYKKYAEMLGRVNQATNVVDKDIENFSASVNDVSANISVMEDRLYELAVQGKQDSEEFKNLVQQVGKLKRAIAETDMVIERASTTNMDLGQQVGLLEDQLYQLAIEGKQNTAEFKKLAQEAGNLKGKIAEADIAVEEYAITNADLGQKVGILTNKMYRLAEAGKMNSKEFRDTARDAAAAQQQLNRVDLTMEAMSMTGAMRLQTAMGGVQGAFDFANGAMQLFGIESEAAQKAMMKFQAAMQMVTAINTMQQALPAITAIKNNVVDSFTKMTAASKAFALTGIAALIVGIQLLYSNWSKISEAFSSFTPKQRALNATVNEYKEGAKTARMETEKVASAFEAARKGTMSKEQALKTYNETLGSTMGKTNDLNRAEEMFIEKKEAYVQAAALRAQANALMAKAADEYAKQVSAQMEDQRNMGEQTLSLLGKFAKGGAQILTGNNVYITQQFDKAQTNLYNNAQKRAEKDAKKKQKIYNDAFKDIIKQAESVEKKYNLTSKEQSAIDEEAARKAEERAQRARERAQAEADARKQALADISAALAEFDEQQLLRTKTEEEKEIYAVEKRYKELINKAKKYGQDISKITSAQETEIRQIKEKFAAEAEALRKQKAEEELAAYNEQLAKRYEIEDQQYYRLQELTLSQNDFERYQLQLKFDEEIKAAEGNAELKKALEEKYLQDLAAITKRENDAMAAEDKAKKDAEKERIKKLNDFRVQAVYDSLNIISNLTEMFAGKSVAQQKKAFKIQKGVQIAQAIMDTYKAANAALASSPPPFNFIAAGAAITAGLLNVKKIADQKFESATSGGGGGGSTSSGVTAPVQSPEFNIVGNANVNALSQFANTPIQTYVVSGDVTTAQALDRNRISNATL